MREEVGRQRRLLSLVVGAAVLAACVERAHADHPSDLELRVFPETVRFDLATGEELGRGRSSTPLSASPLQLRAVRDEVVAFVVRVEGTPGERPLSWSPVTDSDGRHHDVRFEAFEIRGVEIREASRGQWVQSLGPGRYPDIVVPTATVSVPARPGVAMLWVEAWVPPSTLPGRLATALHVGRVGEGVEVPIEVEVLDLTLPEEDVARLGTVNFGSFVTMERESPERMLRWMQMMHAHHLSVDLLTPPPHPASLDDGGWDWDGWAERARPYVLGNAFTLEAGYRGPREGQPVSRWTIPVTEKWPSPRTDRKLPTDPKLWARALREWESEVERRGWFDHPRGPDWVLFINGLDEPKEAWAFDALLEYEHFLDDADLHDRAHVDFRVDGPFGQGVDGWTDERILAEVGRVADVWNVCGAPAWIPMQALEARRRAHPGEKLMFYASNTAGEPTMGPLVVDTPLEGMRAWGWIVFRYDLDGALNWEVDLWPGCVENPMCTEGGMNLDATLIYRGHEVGRGEGEPIASLRLKALRRGAQDAALLRLLEARDPDAADQMAREIIPRAFGDVSSDDGPGAWPEGAGRWTAARDAILARLTHRSKADGGTAADAQDSLPRPGEPKVSWAVGLAIVALGVGFIVWLRRRS